MRTPKHKLRAAQRIRGARTSKREPLGCQIITANPREAKNNYPRIHRRVVQRYLVMLLHSSHNNKNRSSTNFQNSQPVPSWGRVPWVLRHRHHGSCYPWGKAPCTRRSRSPALLPLRESWKRVPCGLVDVQVQLRPRLSRWVRWGTYLYSMQNPCIVFLT
jgi:hypothetical protein